MQTLLEQQTTKFGPDLVALARQAFGPIYSLGANLMPTGSPLMPLPQSPSLPPPLTSAAQPPLDNLPNSNHVTLESMHKRSAYHNSLLYSTCTVLNLKYYIVQVLWHAIYTCTVHRLQFVSNDILVCSTSWQLRGCECIGRSRAQCAAPKASHEDPTSCSYPHRLHVRRRREHQVRRRRSGRRCCRRSCWTCFGPH